MIIHCTQKLATKLPDVSAEPHSDVSPLGNWHAHLDIIDRRQCVMFCHDTTRYAIFLPGLRKEQMVDLGRLHREFFLASLVTLGVPDIQLKKIELSLGPALCDRATDRSVLGTMNQACNDLDGYLMGYANVLELDPLETAQWLNERPLTEKGIWLWPAKEMMELVNRK